jgi:hypothetical protein
MAAFLRNDSRDFLLFHLSPCICPTPSAKFPPAPSERTEQTSVLRITTPLID